LAIGDLLLLPNAEPEHVIAGLWYLIVRVFGYASILFIMIMFFDTAYQRHSFVNKMKMSIRDIRDEYKNMEGDPMMKVLVVNPIHVAIAIKYDAEETKIPMITGRGEEATAREMRNAAAEAGVPVLRNEQLARALLASEESDDFVPKEFFDIIAEVILWARQVSEQLSDTAKAEDLSNAMEPPGEDLTSYHSHLRSV